MDNLGAVNGNPRTKPPKQDLCPHCHGVRWFNFYTQAMTHKSRTRARACRRIRDAKERMARR